MFINRTSTKYNEFVSALIQYIIIVAPFVWSLWSLEAVHANASEVTAIFNKHYREFFTNKIYFIAFVLDPRKPHTNILIQINQPIFDSGYSFGDFFKKHPIAPNTIVILPLNPCPSMSHSLLFLSAYNRVKSYLKEMLHIKLERHLSHPDELAHALFKLLSPAQIVDEL